MTNCKSSVVRMVNGTITPQCSKRLNLTLPCLVFDFFLRGGATGWSAPGRGVPTTDGGASLGAGSTMASPPGLVLDTMSGTKYGANASVLSCLSGFSDAAVLSQVSPPTPLSSSTKSWLFSTGLATESFGSCVLMKPWLSRQTRWLGEY